tara:strand:- start:2656 stop:3819 length:1164 start_codon:yes stop_codon:yes gene_type:complete
MKNISKSDKDTGLIFEAYADSKKELLNEFTPTQGAVGGALAGGALGHLAGPRKAGVVPGADVAAGFQPAQVMDPTINDKITNVMSGLQAQDGGQRSLAFAELAANKDEILGALRSDPTNTDAAALAANLETALKAYTPEGAWYDKEFDPTRVGMGAGIGGVAGYMAGDDEEEGVQTASTEIKEEPLNETKAVSPTKAKRRANEAANRNQSKPDAQVEQEVTQGTTKESTHWLKKARLFKEGKKKLVNEVSGIGLVGAGLGAWGGHKAGKGMQAHQLAEFGQYVHDLAVASGTPLDAKFNQLANPDYYINNPQFVADGTAQATLKQIADRFGGNIAASNLKPVLPNTNMYGTIGAAGGGALGLYGGEKLNDAREKKAEERARRRYGIR